MRIGTIPYSFMKGSSRAIDIPKAWKNQEKELYLERIMWQSKAWIDGKPCVTQDGQPITKPNPHRSTH